MSAADLHTLTGAYAAHALGLDEREDFERHLERCPACAQEVAEFTATLARLGSAQTVAVSAEFKQRVMNALDTVRQEPPGPAAQLSGARTGMLRRALPRFALAACLALAVGAGGLAVQQHHRADRARATAVALQQQQGRFAALLTAPDARTTSGKVAGGGVATVVWSQTRGAAGFLASGMPLPAEGTTYQLWFNDGGTMRPAGLLPTAGGAMMLSGPLDGASGVGVTVEPAGGSPQPTGPPLLLLAFS